MPCVKWPPWARSRPSTVSPTFDRRQVDGHIGLAARVGLHVDVIGAEQLPGPVASQVFDHVDVFAAAVIAAAGVTFGVFVRQHAADGLHDRRAGVIFTGDHFQAVFLPLDFFGDGGPDFGILLGEEIHQRSHIRKDQREENRAAARGRSKLSKACCTTSIGRRAAGGSIDQTYVG